ncbi:MAG TPA: AraC family transcriptional regulator [Pyrinomonadaceae bacterium]|nr:AraC family transcriptional regulator [Pyrinomonadaceae bacterium]
MPKPREETRRQHESGTFASISQSAILVYFKTGTPKPLFPPEVPARQGSWTGLLVEEHHLPPTAFPDGFPLRHLVAMHYRRATLSRFLSRMPRNKPMRHGSLDIVPQGTALGVYGYDETEFIMLALDPGFVRKIADESEMSNIELVRHLGIRDPQIEYIAFAVKAELDAGCPSGRVYGDGLAVALAARLLGKYSAHATTSHNCNALLPGYTLRRVTDFIEDNLTKDLTLAEIADVAHMSPHYFSRAFRNSTGTPPHRYVVGRRIEKAKMLLSENYLPLVEVGLSVGFQNQSHFTTLFHKRTGVTPKVYRSLI